MRSPVYRNLDKPFQIFGFNTLELIVLCITLVGGGEVLQFFSIHRIWAFLFTVILALVLHWVRHSLGDIFARRLLRFLKLPKIIYSKILTV